MAVKSLSFVISLCFVASFTVLWGWTASNVVPEPYLDEVFHIRQGQAYLQGRWDVWDPKITTPPGLYLVSFLQEQVIQTHGSVIGLRAINVIVGGGLMFLLLRSLLSLMIRAFYEDSPEPFAQDRKSDLILPSVYINEVAYNVCLFPPLFFFYGLYYTDVISTFSVLLTFYFHMRNEQNKLVFTGLISLLFRQTNVFWVGLFLGGLELCRVIPKGRPDVEFPRRPSFIDIISGSWSHSCVYDPLMVNSGIEDYFKSAVSFGIAAVRNLSTVLWHLSSHIVILCAFIEFLVWNGGVVLGDKENHVASVHMAQMLYIWPYFLFFSFPILSVYVLNTLIRQDDLPRLLRTGSTRCCVPRVSVMAGSVAIMLSVVHYNTLIHPFTLADNRHYMFYVFRLLLKRNFIRYAAVPIYFLAACASFAALALPSSKLPRQSSPGLRTPKSGISNRVSFMLVWLLTTTLCLSTAPLVEPRYLILPWITWRLQVAASASMISADTKSETMTLREDPPSNNDQQQSSEPKGNSAADSGRINGDVSSWPKMSVRIEEIWFYIINCITIYIFLHWGFEWPQEPGQVQRFMW